MNLLLIQTITLLLLRKVVKVVYKSQQPMKIDGKHHKGISQGGYILIEWND